MKKFVQALIKLAPFAVVISCAFGLILFEVQQNYRHTANDPQIQLAEDTAESVLTGKSPGNLIFGQQIDIAKSLAPFVIIYDSNYKPTIGSGYLDGILPGPPSGTFRDAENRFTWQPNENLRIAAVLVPVEKGAKGYVLAGRSLKEVEIREANLTKTVILAWFLTLITTFAVILAMEYMPKK